MQYLLAHGDTLRLPLADRSVHMCVTSPPYFGLRDYSTPGQLGLEPTPELFVAKMVAVFREVKRVLRDDGTLWLNLGDSFNSSPSNQQNGEDRPSREHAFLSQGRRKRDIPGLAPKQLLGIPWRVAFALQADGWYLRSDIIWHKPNPMPESVTDRPTKSHEYLFLLAKSDKYFYDNEAVREAYTPVSIGRYDYAKQGTAPTSRQPGQDTERGRRENGLQAMNPNGRNKRSVWTVATKPFKGAHFATFPVKLVEPCIRAGTSQAGCCPGCGTPWRRLVERTKYEPEVVDVGVRFVDASRGDKTRKINGKSKEWLEAQASRMTLGWAAACSCPPHDPVPCTVLDPFAGAASVGVACAALGRRFVGVDLSAKYLRMSKRRLERPHARPEPMVREEAPLPLFAGIEDGA